MGAAPTCIVSEAQLLAVRMSLRTLEAIELQPAALVADLTRCLRLVLPEVAHKIQHLRDSNMADRIDQRSWG